MLAYLILFTLKDSECHGIGRLDIMRNTKNGFIEIVPKQSRANNAEIFPSYLHKCFGETICSSEQMAIKLTNHFHKYGKCSKISNTLKLRTPEIIAENNF